jgi:hypothetical protein
VGRGDLDEIDYWWRYGAENPMVMGLSTSGDFGGGECGERSALPFNFHAPYGALCINWAHQACVIARRGEKKGRKAKKRAKGKVKSFVSLF